MSYLVSDFLINPVLRQARRFSRSSTPSDRFDPLTNRRLPPEIDETQNETAVGGVMEESHGQGVLPPHDDYPTGLSGAPLSASPPGEGDWNRRNIAQISERSSSVPDVRGHRNTIPLRLASYRSDTAVVDDVSDNPLFNITGHFRAESPMSISADSINDTGHLSPHESPSIGSSQSHSQPRAINGVSRHRSSSIPEDDGMRTLRKKILAIQARTLQPEEKARLMHQLMTEGYTNSQIAIQGRIPPPRTHSPMSVMSQERPVTPLSMSSFGFWHSSDSPRRISMDNSEDTFHLTADDLKPTFAPIKPREAPADNSDDIDEEETAEAVPALGCKHYKRNVKLQCYTCSRWYTCRFCHDENEDHTLPRKETRNMLCMLCGCPQRAGDTCIDCGARTAWYYCAICKLWDDDASKSIYHCNDCGICRIGRGLGKDFFHCKTCGLCMSISMEQSHKCIERSTDCDCPICGEYMFTSPQTVVFMRCGHTIHRDCYYAHMKTSYKCPICSQTVVNMETQFRNLDRAIAAQPMPPQFQDTQAMITCNDCRAKSAVPYHWLGLKCAVCDSYNTAQLSIISDPEVAVPSIEIVETGNDIPIDMENRDPSAFIGSSGSAHTPGPSRNRRHSSHIRPNEWSPGASARFSPYPQIQRTARSASPLRGGGLRGEDDAHLAPPEASFAVESDDDDDDITFWGGQPRNGHRTGPLAMFLGTGDGNNDLDDSDADLSSVADDDMDEDDDDEVDHMELLGHR